MPCFSERGMNREKKKKKSESKKELMCILFGQKRYCNSTARIGWMDGCSWQIESCVLVEKLGQGWPRLQLLFSPRLALGTLAWERDLLCVLRGGNWPIYAGVELARQQALYRTVLYCVTCTKHCIYGPRSVVQHYRVGLTFSFWCRTVW